MIENFIIEGVDRLGKSTLISGLKNRLGYFQVLHFQKPELLECYTKFKSAVVVTEEERKRHALKRYQEDCFEHLLCALSTTGRYICDRSHLGEAVYAHRYRGYSGDYVFDLEDAAIKRNQRFDSNTLLVLLTTSDFSFITDDGESHDFSKKEEEQEDFKQAFYKSRIKNKIMIDVAKEVPSHLPPTFKPAKEILEQVINNRQL